MIEFDEIEEKLERYPGNQKDKQEIDEDLKL
jgi:hypothetical protein